VKVPKGKIINAFLPKPIGVHDLIKEVNTQLHDMRYKSATALRMETEK
jgi:hypothetical protein